MPTDFEKEYMCLPTPATEEPRDLILAREHRNMLFDAIRKKIDTGKFVSEKQRLELIFANMDYRLLKEQYEAHQR